MVETSFQSHQSHQLFLDSETFVDVVNSFYVLDMVKSSALLLSVFFRYIYAPSFLDFTVPSSIHNRTSASIK